MNIGFRIITASSLGVLLIFQFYFLYSGNFDNVLYDETGVFLAGGVVLFFIPLTTGLFVHTAFTNENIQAAGKLIGMCSVIITGPCTGFWAGYHEKKSYAKYGVKTYGIVTQAFYSDGDRMYYKFDVNGSSFYSFNVSNPLGHLTGDSVEIIYNARCPKMNDAIENL